jgi:ATP synthase delta (OSCP) subunit.
MSNAEIKNYTEFVLPSSIVSKADVSRLVREFEAVDNALTTKKVKNKAGVESADAPAMSPQLQAFLEANTVDLENTGARSAYVKQLRLLKDKVRVMNMTFAVITDPESLQELIVWVRESVHPQTVIEAHLQPALVAGVYLRSQNHVFDLSVRNALKAKRGELEKELGALRGSK